MLLAVNSMNTIESVPSKPRCIIAMLAVVTTVVGMGCQRGGPESAAPAASAPAPAAAATPMPAASTSPSDASEEAPSDTGIAKMLQPWKGDLDGMVERRYVRMLVTFSKTNYFLDGPKQYGATYDGGKHFEEFLNKRLGTKHIRVQLAFIPVSRDRIFQALAEGKGDIAAANLTITPERAKRVNFSKSFVRDVREVVVTAASQAELSSPEDLSGRKVHVRRSSSYFESLNALNAKLRGARKPPVEIVPTPEQLEDEDLIEMVNAGLVPATIADAHKADLWAKIFTGVKVHPGAAVRTGGEIAWALRRDTPKLAEAVNAFVAANPPGSLQYNLILQRYFKDTKWAKNATAEEDLRRYRDVVAFFRKYGDQYDFPWLLVAAQAYQESQIDQSRKSSVGAVGVMQIKPSTAEGDPINIRGVDKSAEKNIEAGVKYLRFIADRYFNDAPMDRLNKGLFTLASYNAGPARVTQLRKKAQNMGLDPNRWFGHVEVVAAREIGRETVQYVSNIYKYYVSYQLIAEQRENRRRARGGT
jgi:membrane-bound lytic murein transglycosylase MltF